MDTVKICELLRILNDNKPSECSDDLMELLSNNLKKLHEQHTFQETMYECTTTRTRENPVTKYFTMNFYLLKRLKCALMESIESSNVINVLSVQQHKIICDVLQELMNIGICFNLQPKLPQRLQPPSSSYNTEDKSITSDYDRLCFTTKKMIDLLDCDVLRPIVVFVGFQIILNAVYQIVYCPLKKPQQDDKSDHGNNAGKVVTEELYEKFLTDKKEFRMLLDKCSRAIPKNTYVKETMLLLKTECTWLKKAAGDNLTGTLRSTNGLRTIIHTLLENPQDYDSNKICKALDLIVKLVVSLKGSSDFETNICQQIKQLIVANPPNLSVSASTSGLNNVETVAANVFRPYETIFVSCTKFLYNYDLALCRRQFLPVLLEPLLRFLDVHCTRRYKFENNDDIMDLLQRTVRLLKLAFFNNNINESDLPYRELSPVIVVIFRCFATNEDRDELHKDLAEILISYLQKQSIAGCCNETFDCFMLNIGFREDVTFTSSSSRICITTDPASVVKSNDPHVLAHILFNLIKNHTSLQIKFFLYLLQCLQNKEKYFSGQVDEVIEKNLLIYNMLSSLAEDKNVQEHISDNPKEILDYIAVVLESFIERNVHKYRGDECETTDFQTIFLLIMILQALTARHPPPLSPSVLQPLIKIRGESFNEELSKLVTSVINALTGLGRNRDVDKTEDGTQSTQKKSELDKAIDDVCDPLLPIRGHGLMTLVKLIEDKNPEVLERKLFVLNIFQQNVKNQDSFIYLSAINGLALMGDLFPDIVLETLTDEFAGCDQNSSLCEIRMKLGEVLVKVTRNLGGRVTKYKSLLLNTFMLGAKVDDHLIRTSSLSNLGEVCRVLGYKLGSIVNEVMDCVHGVITTDPSVEARRAAVTVIRQLFLGLESETISFLKDDILDVYRTLKHIYYKDADDVMRLQAQLALEELNINVKAFLFTNLTLTAQETQQNNVKES